jgi:hypothetical protein
MHERVYVVLILLTWLENLLGILRNSAIIPIPDLYPPEFRSRFCFSDRKTCSRQFGTPSRCFGILFRHRIFQFHAPEKVPPIFILPAKITFTHFRSKKSRCNFGGMIIFPPKLDLLVLSRYKFGGMIILPAKITLDWFSS